MNILILNTIINNLQKNNRMNDKKMTKSMILKGVTAAICITAILLAGCSTVYEEKMVYNNIEIPFKNDFPTDTVTYDKLRAEHTRVLLNLSDPSSKIVNKADCTFRTDQLVTVTGAEEDDLLRITSWSAKTIHKVSLEMYIPEAEEYLPVAYLDSIPAFSSFEFKPSFVGKRSVCRTMDGGFVSLECPHLDMERMKVRLVSDDEHLEKLSKIDAKWTCSFSNYSWTPTAGDNCPYRELRPIYAREWVVIVTNYAYMMTTLEYNYVMSHFREVMGGDLCDNDRNLFNAEKYQTEKERFKSEKTFRLGQSSPAYGGLGGGYIWAVTDWNFYGHYASFSGWESIAHEFMHCMGYSHNSNMTYAANNGEGVNVGWTEFIWQLHLWLSYKGDLPYPNRNLLGFHKPENASYRDCDISAIFQDDTVLKQNIERFCRQSRLVKYFTEHPIDTVTIPKEKEEMR